VTNLRKTIAVGEEQRQNRTDPKEVLDLECVEIGIMGRLVVVEHQINDVGGGSDEQELEGGEV
jgi:hypothetical protein